MIKRISNKVIENSFFNFLLSFISRIGGFIFTIIIARLFLPELFGIFTLTISIALMFVTFSDLGINQTLIRYVSYSLKKRNKKQAAAYYRYLLKIKVYLSLIISVLLILIAYPLAFLVFKKPLLFYPLLFSSVYIFFYSISGFFESSFFIIKKVKFLAIKQALLEILKISLIFPVFLIFKNGLSVSAIILFLSVLILLFTVPIIYFLRKQYPFFFQKSTIKIDQAKILKFIYYLTIGSISIIFYSYIDTFMIGLLVPNASYIGFYRAAFSLAFGIASLFTFSNIFLQTFTESKKKTLQITFDKFLKYSFMLTIPSAFGLAFFAKYFIKLFFGYKYLPAFFPLTILSFSIMEAVAAAILVSLFSAKEKPKLFVKYLLISTILNIVLNYFFITFFLRISELWAITGAAIATLLSRLFYISALFILTKKHFSLSLKSSSIIKPLISSIIMLIVLVITKKLVNDMTILIGILLISLGILVYFLVMLLIKGFNKGDFNLFKSLFLKKMSKVLV